MKIVTWNANDKFSEKFPAILEKDTDIYIIQECENPLIIDSEEYADFASKYFWVGENQYYGLGMIDDANILISEILNKFPDGSAGLWNSIPMIHDIYQFICSSSGKAVMTLQE